MVPAMRLPSDKELLFDLNVLGKSAADQATVMMSSRLAPDEDLRPAAIRLWKHRKTVPDRWRHAILERMGYIKICDD